MRTSTKLRPLAAIAAIAAVAATLAVVATPAVLLAHARLIRSTPSGGATLSKSPASLELWFSERPELRFSTLALVDSAGASVPLGALSKVAGDPMGLSATITTPLADGRYTVSWRTAADDGHATSGKFSFVVASPNTASPVVLAGADSSNARRAASQVPNTVVELAPTSTISTAVRWADLVAVLAIVGATFFGMFVVPRAQLPADVARDAEDRARRLARSVLLLFVVTTAWRLSAQADLVPSASTARMSAMMTVVGGTGWGAGWLVGAAGAVIVAVGLVFVRSGPIGWFIGGLGAMAIAFGEALTGHPAASKHVFLATAVDVTHVLGAGGWLGGLAALTLCGLAATRRAESAGGTAMSQSLVRAYHRSAVACVSVVLATALAAAWMRLGAVSDLWTSPYGRTLALKVALAVILLGFGWFHWRTAVIPEWTDDTRFRFRRSVALELAVGAGIVAATAVLITTALPRS